MKRCFCLLSVFLFLAFSLCARADNYLIVIAVGSQPLAARVFAPLDGSPNDGKAIISAAQAAEFIPPKGEPVERNAHVADEELSLPAAEDFLRRNHYLLLSTENGFMPTKSNILALSKIAREVVHPDDTILTFSSCHGAVVDGEAYLIPADTRIPQPDAAREGIKRTAVSVHEFSQAMSQVPCNLLIGVYDMCRTPLLRDKGVKKEDDGLSHILGADRLTTPLIEEATLSADTKGARNSYTLFSTMDGHSSLEDADVKRGIFSKFFDEGLRGGAFEQGVLTLESLKQFINVHTRDYLKAKYKIDDDDLIPVAAGKVGKKSQKGKEVEQIPLLRLAVDELIGYVLDVKTDLPFLSANIDFTKTSLDDSGRLTSRNISLRDIRITVPGEESRTSSTLGFTAGYAYDGEGRQPTTMGLNLNKEETQLSNELTTQVPGVFAILMMPLLYLDIPLPEQAEKKIALGQEWDWKAPHFNLTGETNEQRFTGHSKVMARDKVGSVEAWKVDTRSNAGGGAYWLDCKLLRLIRMEFQIGDGQQKMRFSLSPIWKKRLNR